MKIKENDIFRFSYSSEYQKENSYLDHCFDGQLVAKKNDKGIFELIDTYWSFGDKQGHYGTVKEWKEKGTLTFVVYLNDLKKAEEYEKDYYAEKDWFNLSYQHGCYKKFAIKKTAKKDKTTMIEAIQERIKKAKYDAEYAICRVEEYGGKLAKVESGDLEVYI